MERCLKCFEVVDLAKGIRCRCQREARLKATEKEVAEWIELVGEENARRALAGGKGNMKGGFDAMKALARSARLNISDLEERADYRRTKSAEVLGDPLKTAKWRRPKMLPPRSVEREII